MDELALKDLETEIKRLNKILELIFPAVGICSECICYHPCMRKEIVGTCQEKILSMANIIWDKEKEIK